jgi:phosphoribosylamine--glycine ligase
VNILLLGSGGREHAFAKALSSSIGISKLYIAPGNAGTNECGQNIQLNPLDFDAVIKFCIDNDISLLIPGNEDPLVHGIVDFIEAKNIEFSTSIKVAGPNQYCAQLEGSKDFAKAFMIRHNIPTAAYKTFDHQNISESGDFFSQLQPPYVLKADGLAAGKGVIITSDLAEAQKILNEMILGGMFGDASKSVVIEEFLPGIEISVFAIGDGNSYRILASAKDYKRIFDNDKGPNTGGMGAISPVPFADEAFMLKVENEIIRPTFEGLKSEGNPFKGFLFLGLMNVDGQPKVIEYNVRMGDPETEAIFPRLKTNMLEMLSGIAQGNISELDLEIDSRTAATIFLVSGGYPGDIEKGKKITLPNDSMIGSNQYIFHAGTALKDGELFTNGGRVIAVTSLNGDIPSALNDSNKLASEINFDGKFNRKDIGLDLLNYGKN